MFESQVSEIFKTSFLCQRRDRHVVLYFSSKGRILGVGIVPAPSHVQATTKVVPGGLAETSSESLVTANGFSAILIPAS